MTEYVIVATHEFYGPEVRRALVSDEQSGRAARFSSRDEARQHIDEYLNVGTYYLAHNEVGRPSYQIRTVQSLPQYLAWAL